MTAYKLDHVGVAVSSIDSALGIYRALGLDEAKREVVPGQKVTVAFLPVGDSRIELLEPTSADSPVAKFLAKNPRGGIHHFSLGVASIDAATADMQGRGVRVLGDGKQLNVHGERIAFVHPQDFLGALVELEENAK